MEGSNQFGWVEKLVGGGVLIPPNTASANLIGRAIAAAVGLGAQRPALLDAVGISEATIRNQLSWVPGVVLNRLLLAIETQLNKPAAVLEIGRDSKPRCFSDIGYATRLLPTLYDVIEANVQMQELRQNIYRTSLAEHDEFTILKWNALGNDPQDIAAAVEFSMVTYVRLAREIWGERLIISGVSMRDRPRFDVALYEQYIGAPIVFGTKETMVEFLTEQCRAPSPFANPTLLAAATKCHWQPVQWFDAGLQLSAFTYFYLWTELNKSPVTLDRVARSFGMAERTLRRNLVEQGNPFRSMLDDIRKSMCDLYKLENKRSLAEVAELLGYGELSAFTRAYRRWYGEPPSKGWQAVARKAA
ncbi:MAG TPA: AraC family transcriptional regulator ligand-binding domain-containing protein [Sphingorhabdus sp.]|nr:AraC family transcriptional regulator ligand-binding domain-containing protein [Sphingorhabdus sp.]